jgi:gliding motility-associated-like protein
VCSQVLNLAIVSGSDQLSWQTSSAGISNIQIDRNNAALTTVTATATSYNDNAVTCKTNYCYQIVSNYAGGATSTSLQKCGTAFLTVTPPGINNTSAVVGGAQVDLSWLLSPGYTSSSFNVLRSASGGSYSLLGTSATTQFTDGGYAAGYCYAINYTDNCDNISANGLPSCPITLKGAADNANNVNLQWSGYKGWNLGVKSYVVQKFNAQGQLLLTVDVGTDTTYLDTQVDAANQLVLYKVTANANQAGVSISVSNEIRIVKGVDLFYPTAFNPESKVAPVNRTFIVQGHFIVTMTLEIFDRWGSLVFYSDKNEAWDGRRDGIAMPESTYVWTAEGTDMVGNTFRKAGTVLLIRK